MLARQIPNSLRRAYTRLRGKEMETESNRLVDDSEVPHRKKSRCLTELSPLICAAVAKDASVGQLTHATIAVKHRIKRSLVSRIVKAHRMHKDILDG